MNVRRAGSSTRWNFQRGFATCMEARSAEVAGGRSSLKRLPHHAWQAFVFISERFCKQRRTLTSEQVARRPVYERYWFLAPCMGLCMFSGEGSKK